MLFSVNWLKKWVDIDLSVDELAGKLTASGLEVDTVEPVAAPFSGVVVAEITSCGQHPDADKLKVCSIDFGGAGTCPGGLRRTERACRYQDSTGNGRCGHW